MLEHPRFATSVFLGADIGMIARNNAGREVSRCRHAGKRDCVV
jgi:hypothetical protein